MHLGRAALSVARISDRVVGPVACRRRARSRPLMAAEAYGYRYLRRYSTLLDVVNVSVRLAHSCSRSQAGAASSSGGYE